jgi:ubiquinone/menaquinone biosynthesis C-methylase UbiE
MGLSAHAIADIYRKRAKHYDISANLYCLIGFREYAYRRKAVTALDLQSGDAVVEIGCGAGLNFPLLQLAVGPEVRLIGVDLTDAMLEQARQRVQAQGRSNVELVYSDAAVYEFPRNVDGVISTFAISLRPDYDRIIQCAATALAVGRRCSILNLKKPDNFPCALVKLGEMITRPFAVSLDLVDRHAWESVEMYPDNNSFQEFYFGFAYPAFGEAPGMRGVLTEYKEQM